MLVLLDSNVWLAALAHDGFCRSVLNSSASLCTPVVTPFICREVRDKLIAKFRRTGKEADELIGRLASLCLFKLDAAAIASPLRDPDDTPILAAAVAYKCKFLVTGDGDLLELKLFAGVEIVSVRAFAERIGAKLN